MVKSSFGLSKASTSLNVQDSRNGRSYLLPIDRNAVRAVDLKQIVAPSDSSMSSDLHAEGLRVIDEGFCNTAPVRTRISHL